MQEAGDLRGIVTNDARQCSDGWSWIEPFDKTKDGWAAFVALDKYYSGDGESKHNMYQLVEVVYRVST